MINVIKPTSPSSVKLWTKSATFPTIPVVPGNSMSTTRKTSARAKPSETISFAQLVIVENVSFNVAIV